MASVLLCEDERLGRRVAVKRLHADSPVDVEHRFNREARLGASLNHPNLVSVFDTTTDEEGVLIVMEYVDGEPLSRMLRRGPLRPEEVRHMVLDLGDALDHAHAHGIVHRDVKPGNVLIRADGVTKLADLGIAIASDVSRITRSGTVLGTAAYMAPEQLDGRDAGPEADIYSLAAIAYEALSGRKPREGRTPMEIAHRIATDGPPDLREAWPMAPKPAARVLQRGMARNPAGRPASAGALASELAEALEETPKAAPAQTKKTRFLRREWKAAAAASLPATPAAAAAPASAPAVAPDTNGSERDPTPPETAAPAKAPAGAAAPVPAKAAWAESTAPSTGSPAREDGPPTSPPISRGSVRRRPNVTAVLLTLVFVALAAATILASVLSGGDAERSTSPRADRNPAQAAKSQKRREERQANKEQASGEQPSGGQASRGQASGGQATPAVPAEPAPAEPAPAEQPAASGDPVSGAALNDEGFRLMNQGRYDEAIPILQEAVNSFPTGTDDLNYAYALYNLGRSLRLAGRADEAVAILEKRLQIQNQTETVRRELELARQQASRS